jgi:hypothetical protein
LLAFNQAAIKRQSSSKEKVQLPVVCAILWAVLIPVSGVIFVEGAAARVVVFVNDAVAFVGTIG